MINEYVEEVLNEKQEKLIKKKRASPIYWTKAETELLLEEKKKGTSNKEIAKMLNKNIGAVITKYNYITKYCKNYVIPCKNISEVKEYIKNNLDKTDNEIAKEVGRTKTSISNLRRRLGIKRIDNYVDSYREYTDKEIELIKKGELSVKEISEITGRSSACIYVKRSELGVTKKRKRNNVTPTNLMLALKKMYGEKVIYTQEEILKAMELLKEI